jgi:hypothetical protein
MPPAAPLKGALLALSYGFSNGGFGLPLILVNRLDGTEPCNGPVASHSIEFAPFQPHGPLVGRVRSLTPVNRTASAPLAPKLGPFSLRHQSTIDSGRAS